MSAAKHILLNQWHGGMVFGRVIWTIAQWEHRKPPLVEKYGDKTDERFIVAIGGLKRLKILKASLDRLDSA